MRARRRLSRWRWRGRSSSVLAVWAVAKTGAAFVPVDPNYPAERIEHMLTDSGAVLGLTVAAHAVRLPDTVAWLVLDDPAVAAAVASALGRAGHRRRPAAPAADRPPGLPDLHLRLHRHAQGRGGHPPRPGELRRRGQRRPVRGDGPTSRTLHFSSPSFDASVLELLLAVRRRRDAW